MNQLITKYQLRGKRVLSVGAKVGHEEYWFYQSGCSLTLVDVDEDRDIEPLLQKASSTCHHASGECLTYIIGDAVRFPDGLSGSYDVCYLSSFTPDELRKAAIRGAVIRTGASLARRAVNRLVRMIGGGEVFTRVWPRQTKPFLDAVMTIASHTLRKGGVFILQSYASTVRADDPHYVKAVRDQLASEGIQLLVMYYFVERPATHLIIGFRGTRNEAVTFLEGTKEHQEVFVFHGRGLSSVARSNIAKSFDLRGMASGHPGHPVGANMLMPRHP